MKYTKRVIVVWLAAQLAAPLSLHGATPNLVGTIPQNNPNWVAFHAVDTSAYVDAGLNNGYRTADTWSPSYVGNSFGGEPIVTNGSAGSLLGYTIEFDRAGTYFLYQRFSLLNIDGGGSDDEPSSYVDNNSIFLPHAFDDFGVGDKPGLEGSLADARRNVFDNSQWPFPHAGHYAWSITELGEPLGPQPNGVIYHNYSLFPAHQLEVSQQDVDAGIGKTLFIKSRERGWALDAFALVHQDHLPVIGDQAYHPEFDGQFLDTYYLDDITIGSGLPGESSFYETEVRRFDWTGDGVADAVEAHPIHFSGGWRQGDRQIDVFALDLGEMGDTHPDTGIDINGRRFETHFEGFDPDGGATQPFLDALFLSDFDEDGTLGVSDADALSSAIYRLDTDVRYDVDQDGGLAAADLAYWTEAVVGVKAGDANLDFRIDDADLDALAGAWRSATSAWSAGDFNADGVANDSDLSMLAASWRSENTGDFNEAWQQALDRVPEPAAAAVLIPAAIGISRRRKHERRSSSPVASVTD